MADERRVGSMNGEFQNLQNESVQFLIEALDRHKKALSEGGRPDLAKRASVCITGDGTVMFSYHIPSVPVGTPSAPEVLKAVDIDPLVARGT